MGGDNYFNTSHVNVNPKLWLHSSKIFSISIHLMLMLIKIFTRCECNALHFNTSHVNVNPAFVAISLLHIIISIHLMLMLIPVLSKLQLA